MFVALMSALGHKQTFREYPLNVRFRGQSGPFSPPSKESANSQKRTYELEVETPNIGSAEDSSFP